MSDELPGDSTLPGSKERVDICRLCLMAAIVFAFGKEALMFI